MANTDEYIEKLKQKLGEWEEELGNLEEKARGAREDLRREWEQRRDDLRARRDEVRNKLEELRSSAGSTGEELKRDLDRMRETISRGIRDLRDQLRR